ncbi:hypothetical protein AWC05_05185 [Mycobacterium florentinum]|uniref:Fatty acyl-AMP ligase FadD28 and polyketide synthase n=1 Tax=Mycobacterium florentinum TaxID=292462 RepID=A0A1X1TTR4_MYCFL|nr:hypothetical protein [Mycobacterium florentinum]MCV7408419.1 hypothetical protein [Mycobacterium florentinum]ORV47970.1 hypothetical protein AWC05_05185 [Mycobacterium florentinum]BBX78087.1 hypothetical protein MFLOJ_18740 [Mycobacterium florentinum]
MTRLALLDQAAFLRLRATEQGSAVQCTWIYDRDINIDELRSVQTRLGDGLLGRRIERSPLPFGRHRWVLDRHSPDIALEPRQPRSEIGAWIDRRARVPVDPEYGPTFHVAVLPLDDGGTAVTLVSSHCIVDGLALATAITEAVNGERRNLGYSQPNSRSKWRAVAEDLAHTVVALPAVIHALIATLLIVLKASFGPRAAPGAPRRVTHDDDQTAPPAVTLQTDAAAWDARARSINGSSNTLFVAFMARLAHRIGRVASDGNSVTIVLPVSDRTSTDDDRANALTSITLTVDGRAAVDDLNDVRADVKSLLTSLEDQPNEMLAGLPLIPFTPRWLVRRAEGTAMSTGQLPVGCSNMGTFDAALGRIDGADATEVSVRLVEQGMTRSRIEQMRGQLFCATGTISGSRFLAVSAYQCGADNTAAATRELACGALADVGLHATTVHHGGG